MADSAAKTGGECPSVAVIIPTRDCLGYLQGAVASVEAQNVPGLELIVIDDGSSDGTAEWLEEMRCRRAGMIVLRGSGDGPNVSRNRGIAAASAPLVAFLDADDVWYSGKLEAQLAFHAANPEATFSFTDYLHVDPAGASHGTSFEFWSGFRRIASSGSGYRRLDHPLTRILAENAVGTSTIMAQRCALQNASGFDASLHSASDWDLWLRLARVGPVGFTTSIGTRYLMQRPGNVSGNVRLRIECMHRIVEMHAPFVALTGGYHAVQRAHAHVLQTEAELARAQRHYTAAATAGIRALRLAPSLRNLRAVVSDVLHAAAHAAERPTASPASAE